MRIVTKSITFHRQSLHVAIVMGIAWVSWVSASACRGESTEFLPVWPDKPPGDVRHFPPEADSSGDDSPKVAGKRVIRLANVSKPTLQVFRPDAETNTGTAVVICPGGGHRILAYDLEGTEVAEWLQTIGVTGIVLKYRVPARNPEKNWESSVQDAQRAVSIVRHESDRLKIDTNRIGILGFSAGGQTAALTSLMEQRQYEAIDIVDNLSQRPNFTVLVYTAYLVDDTNERLVAEATVNKETPPMFLVHAFDDPIPLENSLLLYLALKRAKVPSELHAFSTGGHGFGLRRTSEPCSRWPDRCEAWLQRNGWLSTQ